MSSISRSKPREKVRQGREECSKRKSLYVSSKCPWDAIASCKLSRVMRPGKKGLTSKIYRIETAIGESEVSNTVSPNFPVGQSFPFST